MRQPSTLERQDIAKELLFVGCEASLNAGAAFAAFFDHYDALICPSFFSDDSVATIDSPAIRSHKDVLLCIRTLKDRPTLSRDEFLAAVFPPGTSSREKDYALRAIIRAAFLIDCTSKDFHSQGLRKGRFSRDKWEADQPFVDFLHQAFASSSSPELDPAQEEELLSHKDALKAWKLVQRHGVRIRPTDNLLEHLLYDPKERSLKIFHHTAFLRAHLKHSRDLDLDLGFAECLRRGTLTPRLLFETLVTIHCIFFPIASVGSRKNRSLLRKLVRTEGFDPDILWVEFVRGIPPDFAFQYWGGRLAELHESVKRPRPANALISWFERHTSERNALTVAIVGLFLSALFGLLATITGILQLVVAWLAWKYPPSSSSGE